ncbi:hypothetical protein ACOSP7_009088 [Xanthoceras sorbifolium]
MVIEIHEDDLDAEIPFNQEILPVVIGGFIDYPRLEVPRFKFTWRLAKGETHLGTDRTVLGTNKWICLLW